MRLAYALSLFKDARITIAKAAELAGTTIYEFMAACKGNWIPVIEVFREELVPELQSIGRHP